MPGVRIWAEGYENEWYITYDCTDLLSASVCIMVCKLWTTVKLILNGTLCGVDYILLVYVALTSRFVGVVNVLLVLYTFCVVLTARFVGVIHVLCLALTARFVGVCVWHWLHVLLYTHFVCDVGCACFVGVIHILCDVDCKFCDADRVFWWCYTVLCVMLTASFVGVVHVCVWC